MDRLKELTYLRNKIFDRFDYYRTRRKDYIHEYNPNEPYFKRREMTIYQLDDFICPWCGENRQDVVHVHHFIYYTGPRPWNYKKPAEYLDTVYLYMLCAQCNDLFGDDETNARAYSVAKILYDLDISKFSFLQLAFYLIYG